MIWVQLHQHYCVRHRCAWMNGVSARFLGSKERIVGATSRWSSGTGPKHLMHAWCLENKDLLIFKLVNLPTRCQTRPLSS